MHHVATDKQHQIHLIVKFRSFKPTLDRVKGVGIFLWTMRPIQNRPEC